MPLTRIKNTAIGDDGVTTQKLDDTAGGLTLPGVQYVHLPVGNTAQRPASPANGQMRYNTDFARLEQYAGGVWQAIDSPPTITSLAYSGSNTATDPAGGETITLTGSNFQAGATVTIGGTSASSVTIVSSTSVTFVTPAKTAGDYDVVFTNSNGLSARLSSGISVNGTPSFTTAAGNIGSIIEDEVMSTITIVAAEPDGGTLSYSVTSGALPTGVTLASGGAITGTPNANQTADTTFTFTVTATDDENQTNSRQFNLIVLRQIYAQSLAHSLRLNGTDSYIHRTFGSPTDSQLWTMSCWIKRANNDSTTDSDCIIGSSDTAGGTSYGDMIRIREDKLNFFTTSNATGSTNNYFSTRLLRDVSAWYHIVVQFDKASGTVKGWINGNLEGTLSWNTGTNGNLNRNNYRHHIGRRRDADNWFVGYIADFHWIDGQAKIPTDFAEEYNGVWAPKAYSGTYGNNGFRLDFADNTSIGAATDDASPNTNDWTAVNLNGYDAVKDTPINNFATYNYNFHGAGNNTGEGALKFDGLGWSTTKWGQRSTIPIPKDKKIYIELEETGTTGANYVAGIATANSVPSSTNVGGTGSVTLYSQNFYVNGSAGSHGGGQFAAGDIMGIAVDGATGKVWFSKNGTWLSSGDPSAGTNEAGTVTNPDNEDLFLVVAGNTTCNNLFVNFGQDTQNIASEVSPSNGIGVFEYDVPTGHVALCAKNISASAVNTALDDRPEDYMTSTLYVGDHTYPKSVSVGFQPDMVWVKDRDGAYNHRMFDSVRGSAPLYPNNVNGEDVSNDGPEMNMAANGFTIIDNPDGANTTGFGVNQNNINYVAWAWKAGGAPTADNTAGVGNVPTSGSVMINGSASTTALTGTIAAKRMSVNTKAGFSIVRYTGNSTTGATVDHGLGSDIKLLICKEIHPSIGYSWNSWHIGLSTDYYTQLDTTLGQDNSAFLWDSSGMTDTVFTHGSSTVMNSTGNDFIAYCWAEVPGFSKFGTYTGNGVTTGTGGPFVNTGFNPAFLIIKRADANDSWVIEDNKRSTYNPSDAYLLADSPNQEGTGNLRDFYANGFKVKTASQNVSAGRYFYMAFAENPFKFSAAR